MLPNAQLELARVISAKKGRAFLEEGRGENSGFERAAHVSVFAYRRQIAAMTGSDESCLTARYT